LYHYNKYIHLEKYIISALNLVGLTQIREKSIPSEEIDEVMDCFRTESVERLENQ